MRINSKEWIIIHRNILKIILKKTKRLLEVNYDELERLIEYLLFLDQQKQKDKEKQKIRTNKSGEGREAKISKEEQIILTLIYLRHNVSFQLFISNILKNKWINGTQLF